MPLRSTLFPPPFPPSRRGGGGGVVAAPTVCNMPLLAARGGRWHQGASPYRISRRKASEQSRKTHNIPRKGYICRPAVAGDGGDTNERKRMAGYSPAASQTKDQG